MILSMIPIGQPIKILICLFYQIVMILIHLVVMYHIYGMKILIKPEIDLACIGKELLQCQPGRDRAHSGCTPRPGHPPAQGDGGVDGRGLVVPARCRSRDAARRDELRDTTPRRALPGARRHPRQPGPYPIHGGPRMTMSSHNKVTASHLSRKAYLYVRQSSMQQVFENSESTERQYALKQRAVALGWRLDDIVVVDCDQGQSGASAADRQGFQQLVAEVSLGRAGVVLGLEVSRLARNSSDWHRLLEICALSDTLIVDEDGIYSPCDFNDRLLLGLKGAMSEAELHVMLFCSSWNAISSCGVDLIPTGSSRDQEEAFESFP